MKTTEMAWETSKSATTHGSSAMSATWSYVRDTVLAHHLQERSFSWEVVLTAAHSSPSCSRNSFDTSTTRSRSIANLDPKSLPSRRNWVVSSIPSQDATYSLQ